MKSATDWDLDQKHNKALVLEQLRYHEIKRVCVSFTGSGDDGQIDIASATAIDPEENANAMTLLRSVKVKNTKMPETYENYGGVGTAVLRDWEKKPPTLAELVEEVCYRELENQHGGWEIDVGHSGNIVIEPLAAFESRQPFVLDIWENDDDDYDYESEEYNDE